MNGRAVTRTAEGIKYRVQLVPRRHAANVSSQPTSCSWRQWSPSSLRTHGRTWPWRPSDCTRGNSRRLPGPSSCSPAEHPHVRMRSHVNHLPFFPGAGGKYTPSFFPFFSASAAPVEPPVARTSADQLTCDPMLSASATRPNPTQTPRPTANEGKRRGLRTGRSTWAQCDEHRHTQAHRLAPCHRGLVRRAAGGHLCAGRRATGRHAR
jgi:hypothetical protein